MPRVGYPSGFYTGPGASSGDAPGSAAMAADDAAPRRASKRPKASGAPAPEAPPVPPDAGVHTVVDKRSSPVCDMICDTYRKAVPIQLAGHPFFSTILKYDQTLYRELSARCGMREAFFKVLFGDDWAHASHTHPVDLVMAERASRCVLAMRLGVYNDLRRRARAQDPQRSLPGDVGANGVSSEDMVFRNALIKLMQILQTDTFRYNCDIFRGGRFKGVPGWLTLMGELHAKSFLDTVEASDGSAAPASTAFVDGAFQGIRRARGGRLSGPSFTIHLDAVRAFLA